MKKPQILLFALLLVGCKTDTGGGASDGYDISGRIEAKAIRALFDGVDADEMGDDIFGVIINDNSFPFNAISSGYCRPASIVAWFRFAFGEERIMTNYVLFPRQEDFEAPLNTDWPDKRLAGALAKIVSDGGVAGVKDVRRLRIFTPEALQNGTLLNSMFQKEKISHFTIHGSDCYYWGFKTKSKKFIAWHNDYSSEFFAPIRDEVLAYIIDAILVHETPEEWKIKYIISWNRYMHNTLRYPSVYENIEPRICNYVEHGKRADRREQVTKKMGKPPFLIEAENDGL
jgi:hypothetical protein